MDDRLKKQLEFVLEIDKEKNIFRQTHISGHGRNENDAEHAWHMAIMAYLLREYSNDPIDITRVMLMCLIHDVVEIDAGDTYAYDTERGRKPRKPVRRRQRSDCIPCCPMIRRKSLWQYSRSSRHGRHRKQNLPEPWTTSSPYCLTTAMAEATGGAMKYQLIRYTVDRLARRQALRNYMK